MEKKSTFYKDIALLGSLWLAQLAECATLDLRVVSLRAVLGVREDLKVKSLKNIYIAPFFQPLSPKPRDGVGHQELLDYSLLPSVQSSKLCCV